jgi:antitoxin (DNA-binding transcriptional repressor) of toxin-antitoxin stability system
MNAALAKLPEIMAGMTPGDTLELTKDGELVAIVTVPERNPASVAGTAKDRSFWMAPDFDAPLEDFTEYMQ